VEPALTDPESTEPPEEAEAPEAGAGARSRLRKAAEAGAAAAGLAGAGWLVSRGLADEARPGDQGAEPTPIPATIRGDMPSLGPDEDGGITSMDAADLEDPTDALTTYPEDAMQEIRSGFGPEGPAAEPPPQFDPADDDGFDDALD
jgi:hypothetical protein